MKQLPRSKVLAAALILGLVTGSLVYVFLSKKAEEAHVYGPVVVAKRHIASGTILDASMLETRRLPGNKLPDTATVSPEMAVGKIVRVPMRRGEPISLNNLAPKNKLSQMVPPFMRAVTVALDPIIGVGGFLKPGDRVDVLATFEINEGSVTKTVLQNVALLATGSEVVSEGTDPKTGKPSVAKTQPNATLAVTPVEAEKLILAESKGKLRLTLRRPDDISFTRMKGVTGRAVIGIVPPDVPEKPKEEPDKESAPESQPVVVQQPLPSPPVSHTVATVKPKSETGKKIQIIRGTESEEVVVPQ